MAEHSRVSLVCTVKDEADTIGALLDSMLAQTRAADEIVVNDCGSRDATAAIVRGYIARGCPIRLVAGGYNIASGRNNAVAQAAGPLIACTDAGLRLDPRWLARIVEPLERGEADLVGGFFAPAPQSLFELTLGATNYRAVQEVDGARFLPFGKSMAFRKAAWAAVGGFPERMDHCEDLIFDMALQRAGFRLAFAPDALVHFRPRPSLRAFAQQYYLYARGDGMGGLWVRRHLLRYGVYAGLLGLLLLARHRPWLLLLLLPGVAAYTRAPYRRLLPRLRGYGASTRLAALALVPLIRLVGDVAKMVGYLAGLRQRAARRAYAAVPQTTPVPQQHDHISDF